ncbi:hypothetical protein M9H77_17671 [Catharanthus roseus]|uniref:Uncharacterized protein n=1 Tax=Catharanthus roseus TaxID=4058 RepID=A0ACC0B594_CATRO|nr:hypothetical protein M9H77_17671 [Catharanthus roseus]
MSFPVTARSLFNVQSIDVVSSTITQYGRLHHSIALYVASPLYEGLFRWHERFKLRRVDPLEEGRRPRRVWPNWSMRTPHHARSAVVCNRALVWCLAGIDYEMLKLGSDGLVLGIRTLSVELYCCITCSFKFGRRSCADVS